jgi:hypothetical protein
VSYGIWITFRVLSSIIIFLLVVSTPGDGTV